MKWKGVTWSHIGHTVQTGILYCSNASNQFIFFIKIIYTECIVSSVPSKFIHIYFLLKRKELNGVKKKKLLCTRGKINGYFLYVRLTSKPPQEKCRPHNREKQNKVCFSYDKNKVKAVTEPLRNHQKSFHSNNHWLQ